MQTIHLIAGAATLAILPGTAIAQTAPASSPCLVEPGFNALDFTIGRWAVFGPKSKLADVTMEKKLSGCAILETWSKPAGQIGNGLGLFVYSKSQKTWVYSWAADRGDAVDVAQRGSAISPTEVQFPAERKQPDGSVKMRRWSLIRLPDGSVRELAISSLDQGKNWTTDYDYKWIRQR